MKQSIAYGIEKLGIPCAFVRCKGKELCFMIDTGATDNHILDVVYAYFTQHYNDVIQDIEEVFTAVGLGGGVDCKTCSLGFSLGRTKFRDEFAVLPNPEVFECMSQVLGKPVVGILGGKFLKDNGIVIDYASKCIYSKRMRKKKRDEKSVQEAA